MTIFDRYILKTITLTTFITLVFLLGIDFLIQSTAELDDIGQSNYTTAIMLVTLALRLPQNIIQFLPAAILVGAIMGLGQLSSQQELAIARVSGSSPLRITRIGLAFALVLGCLMILMGETIAPAWQDKSDMWRNQALGRPTAVGYKQGIWLKDGDTIVHVGSIAGDGSIGNLRFFTPNGDELTVSNSNKATFTDGTWHLENPNTISITPDKVSTLSPITKWDNQVTPTTLQALASTKDADTIAELRTLTQFLSANQLNHRQESLRLWQKILQPLSTTTMLLLALPFVFSQSRSTQQGTRLVIGILLGVSYYVAAGMIANLALLFGWPPVLGALLPMALFSIIPVIWLLKH